MACRLLSSATMSDGTSTNSLRLTVLVLDDDQVQLDSICRALRVFAHLGLPVSTIGEARAVLEAGWPVDLVLSDLTLPGGSGHELVTWIESNRPDLPVIVTTGLASNPEVDAVRQRGVPVLRKPFSPADLLAAICAATQS